MVAGLIKTPTAAYKPGQVVLFLAALLESGVNANTPLKSIGTEICRHTLAVVAMIYASPSDQLWMMQSRPGLDTPRAIQYKIDAIKEAIPKLGKIEAGINLTYLKYRTIIALHLFNLTKNQVCGGEPPDPPLSFLHIN